ncbi:Pls/PosA family non-ribosomal peptide synthetase [Pseudonocardia parietis]|uniref:Non-ribosomal peptide synthetase-like protein n=1 Tax=Pseudonocardia parietis TaxID=570936 RepID=A0ABS4VNS1_9PSEU|nr:Pls/PosA family non-ribosomal peptide synthetase [Pseudonocardia parietis]MBP2365565.1 non-ribosomal peptide synthetase-like protein [Pseudonocardia parietis]
MPLHAGPPSPGVVAPISELVLVDRDQAQGRRVRRDERLDHLFEQRCDWVRSYGRPDRLAVDSPELSLTYDELDVRANRLARYLRLRGIRAGDRVALLIDVPAHAYVAMLAVLKIGATYVALDVTAPTGRLVYIVEDARVRTVLALSHLARRVERMELLTASGAELVHLDVVAPLVDELDGRRLIDAERGAGDNPLAYISYASVSGRPEGVAIDHPSICNFVKVAAETYGIRPEDRVYQGMALAFDFAVEEIWVPWVSGATLVPRPPGPGLLGPALGAFLTANRVSALCTVPHVLDTLDAGELSGLRFLLVCGKDGRPDQLRRWCRPGRRFLNVYGPTEATVTATWSVVQPVGPVTIGLPLPTYSTVVLDVSDPYRALPHGQAGEIGIAGIGLACGYLNHDDLTDQVFIRDFLGIPGNPSGRIYRTGDLGRVNAAGELEYLGPVDGRDRDRNRYGPGTALAPAPTAAPARRSDAPAPAAAPAPAPTAVPVPAGAPVLPGGPVPVGAAGSVGLAGGAAPAGPVAALAEVLTGVLEAPAGPDQHFFDDLGADSMSMARFCAKLRGRADLPPVSMKDVYRYPTLRALAAALADDGSSPAERSLLEALAAVLGTEVGPDQHFFDDLGADSMSMARFCARLRKRVDLPQVSIKDVYRYTTIRELATALGVAGAGVTPAPGGPAAPEADAPVPLPEPVGTPRHALCGTLQALAFLLYSAVPMLILYPGLEWVLAGSGLLELYLRAVAFTAAGFVALCTLPIVLKWVLVGRWRPQQIQVWSMAYLRFWIVRALTRANPLALFAGSPLYVLYLRAMGAKVGRGVTVLSKHVPVCTDLISIGDGTIVRKDSFLSGYRAHDGIIQIGPVTLGRDVFVGEKTVLDIGTSIGDGAQLGHTSSLHAGQAVPAGASWHGSPAQATETGYRAVAAADCSGVRRAAFAAVQLLNLVAVSTPLFLGAAGLLLTAVPQLGALLDTGAPVFTSIAFYGEVLLASAVLFAIGTLTGLLVTGTVPRVLRYLVRPERVYRLYGLQYWAHRVIGRTTNRKNYTELFGDSSFVVGYLRWVGYRLTPVVQTGSNFGMAVRHETPYLCSVGRGTVVADGLSMLNADYSASSFRVSPVSIGAENFLGNNIAYPAGGRTGDNCLLATKVMIPVDGPVREGVGLLGSPSFEIPRSVERDTGLELPPDELRRRLTAKDRHNAVSIAIRLLTRWLHLTGSLLLMSAAWDLSRTYGVVAFLPVPAAMLLFTVAFYVLIERATEHLHALAPDGCSIYDETFWRHERAWKVPSETYFAFFDGTPFKCVLWRCLGVRIGRRVFDDGCMLTERSFAAIGDGATLNAGSIVQCHSQEDGAFKSDRTVLGAGVTLGVGAFVHYGVHVGDGAVLAADSFLMKGEEVPAWAHWGGNPAGELRSDRYAPAAVAAPPPAVPIGRAA